MKHWHRFPREVVVPRACRHPRSGDENWWSSGHSSVLQKRGTRWPQGSPPTPTISWFHDLFVSLLKSELLVLVFTCLLAQDKGTELRKYPLLFWDSACIVSVANTLDWRSLFLSLKILKGKSNTGESFWTVLNDSSFSRSYFRKHNWTTSTNTDPNWNNHHQR